MKSALRQAWACFPATALLLLPPLAGTASAAGAGGWAWSSQATGSFTASSNFSFNSAGGTVTITNTATGRYNVKFNDLTLIGGGNVQVVAYGGGSEYCNVSSWGGDTVSVVCFNQGGALANTLFVVTLTDFRGGGNLDESAYLWWDDPPNPAPNQTPPDFWNFNSTGGHNGVTRRATGVYDVQLDGIPARGTLLVTAYDSGVNAGKYCTAMRGRASTVQVACFDAFGNRANSRFSLALAKTRALLGSQSAWINDRIVGCCGVGPAITFSSTIQQDVSDGPVSSGNFVARFSGLIPLNKSVAFVSSDGKVSSSSLDEFSAPFRCKLTSWGALGSGTEVRFRCFDSGGQPATLLTWDIAYVTTQ
jgi:hypothetical protein